MYDIYNDIGKVQSPKETNNNKQPFDKQAWGERKQAEKKFAYEMIDNAANEIKGDTEKFKQYLETQSRLDKYSVANTLLIMHQCPDATQLKPAAYWFENKINLIKDTPGVIILEPAGEYVRDDGSTAVSYNSKKVFDISQTHAKDKGKPQVNRDERYILKALIVNPVVPIKAVDNLTPDTMGACYDDKEKVVLVRRGLDNADFFMSVSQELAHAELAKKGNYNRNESGFKAYCVSYMMCKKYGIDTKAFIFKEMPPNIYSKQPNEVRNELSQIRSAMNELNDRMSKALYQNKKPVNKEYER
ncbi:MAG: hypothetical protein EOM05_11630 [Clostridia bacterium]|nr:hypothetical protein [Clostridia bacterium]